MKKEEIKQSEEWKEDLEKILRSWHYELVRENGIHQLENFIWKLLAQKEKEIKEKILRGLPEEGIKWMQEGNHKNRKGFTDGFNECLEKIKELLENL